MSPDGKALAGHTVRLVILSGMSGSGKSTAIRALEDAGYFCIDNLPVVLLPKLMELIPQSPRGLDKIALVVDARERDFLHQFRAQIEQLRTAGDWVDVVFLDSQDPVLMRRYHETRRRHPIEGASLEDSIARERILLADLRDTADQVIDTTNLNPHQLRQIVQDQFQADSVDAAVHLALVSFGFKAGLPAQADLIFDARFLPNPYFVPALKALDGTDPKVADFVLQHAESELFLDAVDGYLKTFRPLYVREGKSYLTVGIGCTGGRHRSVAIVEELGRRLQRRGEAYVIRHRDKGI